MSRRLVALLAWALWALTTFAWAAEAWLDHLLRQAGRPDLVQLTPESVPLLLAVMSTATVGAVVASRRPSHPVGWLLQALGLLLAVAAPATGYANYKLLAQPGTAPAARLAAGYNTAGVLVLAACVGFILLLTPTGSLPSPRWRWWAWVAAAAPLLALASSALLPFSPPYQSVSNPLAVPTLAGPLRIINGVTWAATGLTVLVAAGSLVRRFRSARGLERQQLRWLAYGAALTGVAVLALVALIPTGDGFLLGSLLALCVVLLPLATGVAILRYRLYDLDYLISRTAVYGLLTAGGVGVYVAVVKLFEWLLHEGAGLGGSLVATAVIAVGFAPARDRLQRLVDRWLYGDRHDPVRAVARLGERLRIAPGAGRDQDVLAGVLQGVCETLRLPWASLRAADGTEMASFGRPNAVSEQVSLEHEGQHIGTLAVGVRSGETALAGADRQVLGILAAPVAVALHAVLLSQELQRSRERLVAAREEERRRLRRDLHDGLGPILTAVTLKADAARSAVSSAPTKADRLLAELRGDAKQALGDLRRVVYDLRPASLDELGLLGALSRQMDQFARQGLSITLDAPQALPVLPAAVEVVAYRIITEALTNIVRHTHAEYVSIVIAIDGALCLAVHDDGAARPANRDGWRPGVGLLSMAERVAEVGGTLQAGPTPTGGRVQARLPLELA